LTTDFIDKHRLDIAHREGLHVYVKQRRSLIA